MREQYIKHVKKEFGLYLPRKKRNEIIRDLNEIFRSALEHNETEQQVIERLGTPSDFVKNTLEQLGVNRISLRTQAGIISSTIALLVAIVSLAVFASTQFEQAPEDAIGYANAMTNIRVEGSIGIDTAQVMLVVGLIAAVIAAVQIVRTIWNSRRR